MTILDGKVPIEEMIIDFRDGKFLGVTISVFNRGDGGKITSADFAERFAAIGSTWEPN